MAGLCSGCPAATRRMSCPERLCLLKRPVPKLSSTAAVHMHFWDQASQVMSKLVRDVFFKGLLESVHVFQVGGTGHDEKGETHRLTAQRPADASQISPLTLVVLRHCSRCCVLPWLLIRVRPATTVRWAAIETAAYPGSNQAHISFQHSSCQYLQETWEQRPRCERELCSNRRMEERRSPLRSPREISMCISGRVAGERRLVQADLRRIV